MYRDEETFIPVNYFFKVPKDIEKREVFLLDPMLATGGSAIDAIDLLKSKGVKEKDIANVLLTTVIKDIPEFFFICLPP